MKASGANNGRIAFYSADNSVVRAGTEAACLAALRRRIRREQLMLFLEEAKKKQRVHERQYIDAVHLQLRKVKPRIQRK